MKGWPTPPPGMGPSLGLPNRAPTGGWGIVGTAGATARRLGGCVARVVGKRPSYTQGFGAPPLVVWSGRGMATLGEPVLAYEGAVTKVPGRSGASARSSECFGKKKMLEGLRLRVQRSWLSS